MRWWQKKVRPEEKEQVGDSQVQLGFLSVERVPFSCFAACRRGERLRLGSSRQARLAAAWIPPPGIQNRNVCQEFLSLHDAASEVFQWLELCFVLLFFSLSCTLPDSQRG